MSTQEMQEQIPESKLVEQEFEQEVQSFYDGFEDVIETSGEKEEDSGQTFEEESSGEKNAANQPEEQAQQEYAQENVYTSIEKPMPPAPAQEHINIGRAGFFMGSEIKKVEIDEDIKEEIEQLSLSNKEAALLAMEDSPAGQDLRQRIRDFGISQATDRADILLLQRRQVEYEKYAVSSAQNAQKQFMAETYMREIPDFYEQANNPQKTIVHKKYLDDMRAWIEAKPYTEAKALMHAYENSTNPFEVCELVKRFERESKTLNSELSQKKKLEGALAYPSGNALTTDQAGSKEDFGAGFTIGN